MMHTIALRRWWVLPALLLTSLGLLVACNSETPTPAPTPTVSPETLADAPAIELAPDVQAAIDAMSTLTSYRTRTVYEFGEQPVTGTLTTGVVDILVEYTAAPPPAQRVVMTDTAAPEGDDTRTSQTVRIGDTTWYDMGDGNWIESTEEAGTPFQSAGAIGTRLPRSSCQPLPREIWTAPRVSSGLPARVATSPATPCRPLVKTSS